MITGMALCLKLCLCFFLGFHYDLLLGVENYWSLHFSQEKQGCGPGKSGKVMEFE